MNLRRLGLVFLANPVGAWMLFAFSAVLGFAALAKLPLALLPQARREGYTILTRWPGVDGARIERLVTRPLEDAVCGTSGLEEVRALTEEGSSRLRLSFAAEVDVARAGASLRSAVDAVASGFPRDCEKPVFLPLDDDSPSAVIFTVEAAGVSPAAVHRLVKERLEPALARIPGVGEVQVSGAANREMRVDLNLARLEAHGLGADRVLSRLQEEQVACPVGRVVHGGREVPYYFEARFEGMEGLRSLPLVPGVDLASLGRVEACGKDEDGLSTVDGEPRVTVYLTARPGASLLALSTDLRRELDRFSRGPNAALGLRFEQLLDASKDIRRALLALLRTGIEAILISALFLFFFAKSGRSWLLALAALPAGITPVFFLFHLTHTGLNALSLSGLAIACGLALDAHIVVLAELDRQGGSGIRATLRAVERSARPLATATACALVIFLPLLAMREGPAALFRDFALAVSASLALSFLFALILTPTLWRWMRRRPWKKSARVQLEWKRHWDTRVDFFIRKAADAVSRSGGQKFTRMGGALLLGITALLLLPIFQAGGPPLRACDEYWAWLELPSGTSLSRCRELAREAEREMKSLGQGQVRRLQARIESGRVSWVIQMNEGNPAARADFAARLRGHFRSFHEGFIHVEAVSRDAEGDDRETLEVLGEDPRQVRILAGEMAGQLARVPGVDEVLLHFREGKPVWQLTPDREALALWDMDSESAGRILRDMLYGPVAIKHMEQERQVDVRLTLDGEAPKNLEKILRAPLLRSNGPALPLGIFFRCAKEEEASKSWRRNRKYLASLSARRTGIGAEPFEAAAKAHWKGMATPAGTELRLGSDGVQRKNARKELVVGVCLSLLLVFMLLAILFQSMALPMRIFIVVPPAFATSLLALFACRIPLGLPVYLGWMLLAGLSVCSALLFVDALLRAKRRGLLGAGLVRDAVRHRLRSAFLTTGATGCGLIPMAFFHQAGGEWVAPLALSVCGGLVGAFAAGFLLLPLFWLPWKESGGQTRLDRLWETFSRHGVARKN